MAWKTAWFCYMRFSDKCLIFFLFCEKKKSVLQPPFKILCKSNLVSQVTIVKVWKQSQHGKIFPNQSKSAVKSMVYLNVWFYLLQSHFWLHPMSKKKFICVSKKSVLQPLFKTCSKSLLVSKVTPAKLWIQSQHGKTFSNESKSPSKSMMLINARFGLENGLVLLYEVFR